MIRTTTLITASLLLSCSTVKNETAEEKNLNIKKMEQSKEISLKEKATALLTSLETKDQAPVGYINPAKYKQHNLNVADGLEGFGALIQNAPEKGFKAKVVRSFQDGNYAFSHTVYDFFGPKVGFDIFKFENGKIVEHWDNLTKTTPNNPSNRSQTDGTTAIEDIDKTEANKNIVSEFISSILINGDFNKISNYFDGDNYLQHNSMIADGVSGLGKALEDMAKNGIKMIYTKNHIVLGEGNFVLAVSEGEFAGEKTSFYDLFRLKNGKIAEHWDIIETITPKSEWKNNNGKFNF